MNRSVVSLFAFSVLIAASARAEDLPALKDNEARSLTGSSLQGAKHRVTHAVAASATLKKVRGLLEQRGLMKAQLKGSRYDWQEEKHPHFRRNVIRRVLAAGETPADPTQELQAFRALPKLSSSDLAQRGQEIAKSIQDAGMLGEETLVPIRSGDAMVVFFDKNGAPEETVITGHRVILRRYIAGTPILGPEGELQMRFDASGELEECQLPTDEYHVAGPQPKQLTGRKTLETLFTRSGFAHAASAPHEKLQQGAKSITVESVECGYLDDGNASELVRGCLVTQHETGGAPQIAQMPVDPKDD